MSWNPFPPMGRGALALSRSARRLALGAVHEDTLVLYAALVAMAVSYQGLVAFATTHHLPSPWVWPVPFDIAAFALARQAWRLHKLGHAAGLIRCFQHGLVALSVGLQVSTVTLPPFPDVPTGASTWVVLIGWLWVVLPQLIGHGAPAVIADGLFETALLVKRVGNKRATKPAPTRPVVSTEGSSPAGQRRPTPATSTPGRTAPPAMMPGGPPAPLSLPPDQLALADQVEAMLTETGEMPTKRRVQELVASVRDGCSSGLAQAISAYLRAKAEREVAS